MSENSEAKPTSQRWMLILLLVVCIGPFVLAWYFINFTDIGSDGTKNHGQLINPPRPLDNWALTTLDEEPRPLHGKWTFFYIAENGCESECEAMMEKLRLVHSASGKYSLRIQRVVAFADVQSHLTAQQQEAYPRLFSLSKQDVDMKQVLAQFALTSDDTPVSAGRLYLIDPLGNLMMAYDKDISKEDILDDVKRLLRYSRIG